MFPIRPVKSKRWWQPRYTVLALMWLVYGCYYLCRLNFAPLIPLIMEDLKISHFQIGLIGAFFLAFYSVAQFPVGYLSDIVGPKKIITVGGVTSVIANVFFSAGTSLFYLIGFQGLNGLGQGGGWVPGVKLLNNWFPKSERGRTLGLFGTSESIFVVLAYILAVYLGKMFGWRAVFRIFPMILLFVLFVYWVVVDDHPNRISAQNFRYRTPEPGEKSSESRHKLIVILSNKNVRMACIGFFCLMYISYCNLIWLPTYLYETYGLSVVKAGLLASLYPMVGIVARPLGGYLSDVTFTGRRKPLLLIGMSSILLSTIFLASTDNLMWAMILIISVGFFDQLIGPLFFALELDLLPSELAGTGAGFLSAWGHFGPMFAMFLSGALVDMFGSYKPVFIVLSILAATGIASTLFIHENKYKVLS